MNFSKLLKSTLLFGIAATLNFSANAQCEITSADSYLLSDDPVTLTATPDGGFFAGPGITGDTFDPAAAGEGVHTISYVLPESGTGDIFYIQSNAGDPWGMPTNQTLMNLAFGPSTWTLEFFETLVPADVFSASTGFVYMDGGSFSATALSIFLASNLDLIEDWVNDGGRVFINSAPNEGGDIDFGFGGVTLVYEVPETYANLATITNLEHTALYGPLLPTSSEMSGAYFSHGIITGSGLNTIVINPDNPDQVLLAEKEWGAGRVMFGGLVAHNFQTPTTPVENWRANLLFNMYNDYCTKEITVGGYTNLPAEERVTQLMYPNPAKGIVQFQLIPETTVEIFSIAGEQILAPSLNLQSYDFSMIEAGIYLVVFTNKSSRTTQRLVVR